MTAPSPLVEARRNDSAGRRQRVLTALNQLTAAGGDLSVSSVARTARVHRSFIYRHPDLHAAVLAQATHTTETAAGVVASRESLMADLANAMGRNRRQALHIADLVV